MEDGQVRHITRPLELQPLPLRAALVYLRMRQMQVQVLPTMYRESMRVSTLPVTTLGKDPPC